MFESNESGRFEVYVRPFPATEAGRWQISSNGGQHAVWSRNGRELFFIAADGMLMAVPVQSGATFAHGKPAPLFATGKYQPAVARNDDLAPDGEGFIFVKNTGAAAEPQSIVVVSNWFDEVRAKIMTAGQWRHARRPPVSFGVTPSARRVTPPLSAELRQGRPAAIWAPLRTWKGRRWRIG